MNTYNKWKLFRITEIPEGVNDEKHMSSYWAYSNGQLKEYKVSPGFLAMQSLIYLLITYTEEFIIGYEYANHKLKPFLLIPHEVNLDEDILNNSLSNVCFKYEYHLSPQQLEFDLYKTHYKELYGSFHPLILHRKVNNFIDDFIDLAKSRTFRIFVKISRILSKKESTLLLTQISYILTQLRKESGKSKNKPGNIPLITSQNYPTGSLSADTLFKMLYDYYNNIFSKPLVEATIGLSCEKRVDIDLFYYKLLSETSQSLNIFYTLQDKIENIEFFQYLVPRKELNEIYEEIHNGKLPKEIIKILKNEEKLKYIFKLINPEEFKKIFKISTPDSLATLLAFPNIERPGITMKKIVQFGKTPSKTKIKSEVVIGKLKTPWDSNIEIGFSTQELIRHAFITGITGSGKTTTVKVILSELKRKDIPFLVIEPAKSEYQSIGNSNPKIYEIGAPYDELKMNPFAFPENIHVQTHLDLLKSVFNAAFPMYGPMPYILETALVKVYTSKGWDLYSGHNIYENKLPREELFPTLQDLYNIIDDVMKNIGYSHEITSDIRAALKVRIGSLITGVKGNLLNTKKMLELQKILSEPAVFELEHIGDEGEKIFLMGLVLIMLYEYYISIRKYTTKLEHVIVFEEAHRLLQNVPRIENPEIGDLKGKAIETFTNILAEIRAYGEGIIVVDQIPSKIAPEVIKNTNIKIIHKLLAEDERKIVGNSIGLNDDQIAYLINLEQGEAVIFSEQLGKPMNVMIDNTFISANTEPHTKSDKTKLPNQQELLISRLIQIKRNEIFRDINTLVVFPELKDKFLKGLENVCISYLEGNDSPSTAQIPETLNKLTKEFIGLYLEQCVSKNIVDPPTYYELKNKLNSSDDMLQDFLNNIHQVIEKENFSHPMENYSTRFSRVKFLLSSLPDICEELKNEIEYVINQTTPHTSNIHSLVFYHLQKKSSLPFNTNLISQKYRKEFMDALMLALFKDNEKDLVSLEYYFNVKEINSKIIVDTPQERKAETSQRDIVDLYGELSKPLKNLQEIPQSLNSINNNVQNLSELFASIFHGNIIKKIKWLLILLTANLVLIMTIILMLILKITLI